MAFTLKRDSRLARWAFWFETGKLFETSYDDNLKEYITTYRGKVPAQTSLCNLFWRVFLWAPLCVIVPIGVVGGILAGIVIACIEEPKAVLIALSVLGAILLWIWICTKASRRHTSLSEVVKSTLLYQGAKAVKDKFCPIIKFS
jgi:undecaprenyl pyrophosphate phosphatase UppP